jgi:hypothetical protein
MNRDRRIDKQRQRVSIHTIIDNVEGITICMDVNIVHLQKTPWTNRL